MKERPIIFSAGMVRAILDGRKTQTRRVIKPQPTQKLFFVEVPEVGVVGWMAHPGGATWKCPYGIVGDRLWVRETWQDWGDNAGRFYRADGERQFVFQRDEYDGIRKFYTNGFQFSDEFVPERRWKSARFMPRAASRITLEIVNVGVERVQDISEEDARAEGIKCLWYNVGPTVNKFPMYPAFPEKDGGFPTAREAFEVLWDSINKKRGYGWDVNPLVWVVEFRRAEV